MNDPKKFKLACIQMTMAEEKEKNLATAVDRIGEAATNDADVVVLPELFLTHYFCQIEDADLFDLAETIPGPTTTKLCELAQEKSIVICASIFEKRATGLYHNTFVIIDKDGSISGIYRKMHIPDDPAFYEKFYFTPGDLGFKTIPTSAGLLGPLVCWDQWYPEGARLTAMQGAQVLLYPTAIGWHPVEKGQFGKEQHDAWRTIQRSHAIANGVYVAAINRMGYENSFGGEGIEFWGQSFIADPMGVILAEAPADQETILYADIDPDRQETVRQGWPFLRDRRIDAYSDITRRYIDNDADGEK